jgi:hypothetical protein
MSSQVERRDREGVQRSMQERGSRAGQQVSRYKVGRLSGSPRRRRWWVSSIVALVR